MSVRLASMPVAIIDGTVRFIVGYDGEKVLTPSEHQDMPGVLVLEAHEVTTGRALLSELRKERELIK